MIPVILLGDSGDNQLCAALQGLLRQRCGWHVDGEFFWQANADVLLLDLPFPAHLDAGGGLVVLKESFERRRRACTPAARQLHRPVWASGCGGVCAGLRFAQRLLRRQPGAT